MLIIDNNRKNQICKLNLVLLIDKNEKERNY